MRMIFLAGALAFAGACKAAPPGHSSDPRLAGQGIAEEEWSGGIPPEQEYFISVVSQDKLTAIRGRARELGLEINDDYLSSDEMPALLVNGFEAAVNQLKGFDGVEGVSLNATLSFGVPSESRYVFQAIDRGAKVDSCRQFAHGRFVQRM